MNAFTPILETQEPAKWRPTSPEAWAAAHVAFELADRSADEAFSKRREAAHAVSAKLSGPAASDWSMISRHPSVAPFAAEEDLTKEMRKAALKALLETPPPHWLAWSIQFQLVRELIDDLLNPLCVDDRKMARKRKSDFPGSDWCIDIHHYALALHLGVAEGRQASAMASELVRKVGGLPWRAGVLATINGDVLDIRDPVRVAAVEREGTLEARALLMLHREAQRLAQTSLPRDVPLARAAAGRDDAELIALGERFKALNHEYFGLDEAGGNPPHEAVRQRLSVISGQLENIRRRSRELRATSLDALKVKAVIAFDWAPTADTDNYNDYDHTLNRSLLADLLGLPQIDGPAQEWDAWWHTNGYRPSQDEAAKIVAALTSQDCLFTKERDTFVAARAAARAHDALIEEAWQAARSEAPPPDCVNRVREDGERRPYLSAANIANDPSLAETERSEVLDAFQEWWPRHTAVLARFGGRDVLERSDGALHGRMCDALIEYLQAPAPNLEALIQQMRDAISFDLLPAGMDDIDDPAAIKALLQDDEAGNNYAAMFYQQALRLAGRESPVLAERRTFTPTAELEAAG